MNEPTANSGVNQGVVTLPASLPIGSLIEKAISDPAIDVIKMQSLLDMQITIMDRQARDDFLSDFALMQADFKPVAKHGKTHQNTYATFDDINNATLAARAKYGFSISFQPATIDGFMSVTARLSHRSGHSEETMVSLPFDTSGNKNQVQAIGSALTYGMRMSIKAILSISTYDGDDTDGEGLHETVTAEEAEKLHLSAETHSLNASKIFSYYTKVFGRQINAWDMFPAGTYGTVREEIERQGQAKKPKAKAKPKAKK